MDLELLCLMIGTGGFVCVVRRLRVCCVSRVLCAGPVCCVMEGNEFAAGAPTSVNLVDCVL